MADRHPYDPVLSSKAAAFLVALSIARQRKLIGLLDQLADSPSQIGDYFEPDESGREVQFILVRDLRKPDQTGVGNAHGDIGVFI